MGDHLQLNGILSPFPSWVWLVVTAMGLKTYSPIFLWNGTKFDHMWSRDLIYSWLEYILLFIDQSVPISKAEVTGLRNCKLFFCWSIFCLVISNAYCEFLFSSLATTTVPSTPQTMSDLLTNKLLIGTTKEGFTENSTFCSAVQDMILPEIISSEMTTEYYRLL